MPKSDLLSLAEAVLFENLPLLRRGLYGQVCVVSEFFIKFYLSLQVPVVGGERILLKQLLHQ